MLRFIIYIVSLSSINLDVKSDDKLDMILYKIMHVNIYLVIYYMKFTYINIRHEIKHDLFLCLHNKLKL